MTDTNPNKVVEKARQSFMYFKEIGVPIDTIIEERILPKFGVRLQRDRIKELDSEGLGNLLGEMSEELGIQTSLFLTGRVVNPRELIHHSTEIALVTAMYLIDNPPDNTFRNIYAFLANVQKVS